MAANRGGMLLCEPSAEYYNRSSVVFVPVTVLPASHIGLVWQRSRENARIRTFAETLTQVCPELGNADRAARSDSPNRPASYD